MRFAPARPACRAIVGARAAQRNSARAIAALAGLAPDDQHLSERTRASARTTTRLLTYSTLSSLCVCVFCWLLTLMCVFSLAQMGIHVRPRVRARDVFAKISIHGRSRVECIYTRRICGMHALCVCECVGLRCWCFDRTAFTALTAVSISGLLAEMNRGYRSYGWHRWTNEAYERRLCARCGVI